MSLLYDIAAGAVASTLAGNELAIAAFVHPQLYKLAETEHANVASRLARVLGRVMPVWYGLALLLIAGAAYEHRPVTSGRGLLLMCAAVLWAVIIGLTVALEVPINNRIAALNANAPYANWLEDRKRWDALHNVRVGLLLVAIVLLLAGLLGAGSGA